MGANVREASHKAPARLRADVCLHCGNTRFLINGVWLRWKRERVGLDQRTLAKKLGISGPYLSDIERNRRDCPESIAQMYRRLK